jgi:carboxyl-terminal processing protease
MAVFLVVGWVSVLAPAAGAGEARDLKGLRLQAEQFENAARWEKACEAYSILIGLDRRRPEYRAKFLHCLRRYYQAYRQRDESYRKEVLTQAYPQALKVYHYVLTSLKEGSVARGEVNMGRLFRKGLEEFRLALADPVFIQYNLPATTSADIEAFRDYLQAGWDVRARSVRTPQQALSLVREVAIEALGQLNLNATTVVMEFTCGACYAIDDYTMYLTPAQLRELCQSLKGEVVGVGLRLFSQDGKLLVAEVLAGSAAAKVVPPLLNEVVISIDHKPMLNVPTETAMALLQGQSGTKVELDVYSAAFGPRHLTLWRQPVFVASVGTAQLQRDQVGYLAVNCFQETTPQEVDAALISLRKMGMKALILDLRGNGGGQFEAAIDTARRFLTSGIITATQNPDPRNNMVYRAHNPGALTLPLIVLIDGDTASAAEVLAGALKENKRAVLVGEPTFGKSCIQGLLRLAAPPGGFSPGGLRITVARFCSPSGRPYSGRGIEPHLLAERRLVPDSTDLNASQVDNQLEEAVAEAQRLLLKGQGS